ncbi:hypothetical protein LENED_010737 [Lentinula edodes]|uniref:Uncharacterized protein n=1 Tax=Lentinula edodes TaxID=5353 RepID=A0A1Q3EN94_LENED|nr:hypothetical protein LENED_010737 [Lentinula edodes]
MYFCCQCDHKYRLNLLPCPMLRAGCVPGWGAVRALRVTVACKDYRKLPTLTMSVALPPGLYEIHIPNDAKKKLLAPPSAGETICVGTVQTPLSVWQISGNGAITSFSTGNQTQTKDNPSTVGSNVVTDKAEGMQWIVCGVESTGNNSWTGSIMTNDVTGLFWSIESGRRIVLRNPANDSIPQFHFVPASRKSFERVNETTQPSAGKGALEAILTVIIIVLYMILERSRGSKAKLL